MKTNHDRFFELLRPLYHRLEHFALNMARNRDIAKDVIGETVLIAYDRFDTLKNEQAFLSFLFTIASRLYSARLRNSSRLAGSDQQDVDELFSSSSSPEDYADIQILYEAIDQLPGNMKEAVLLFDITGLSYKEIAEIQATTVDNIKVRLHRGRNKLAEILGVNNDIDAIALQYLSNNINYSSTADGGKK